MTDIKKLGTYDAKALGDIASPALDAAIVRAESCIHSPAVLSPDDLRKLVTAAKMGRDFCRSEIARQWGSFS